MSLWDHQKRGFAETVQHIEAGQRRICLTSPTGGGKSVMICELIRWAIGLGWKVSLYTNRRMLIEQLEKVLTQQEIAFGVRAANYDDKRWERVQISSLPTENSRVFKSKRWSLHDCQLAIVDECHLQKSTVAQNIQKHHTDAGAAWVGVTATPLDIGHMHDVLVQAGTTSELRACGALVPAYHYGPDEPDVKHIKKQKTGEYSEADVRKVIMTASIWARVYEWWQKLNPDAKPTILFAPGVGESLWFAEQFHAKGVSAAHIDGEECWLNGQSYTSDRSIRDDIVAGIKDGSIKIVCNRFVLREGIDIPELEHGIMATVFGGVGTFLQSGGRLLRAHPGKTCATIQDHGGNWWRHGSLNADRHWELEQSAHIVSALREDGMREKREPEPIVCPQCAACRSTGPKCPRCGYESHRKSRMVVQRDGTLKEHTGDIYKPRVTRMKSNTLKIWEQVYYRAKRSRNGMTFRQAEALFFLENYYYPPRDLPYMPKDSMAMFRKVADVPMQELVSREMANA